MELNNTNFRDINIEIESCPPKWCTINKINPHFEGCCHGCGYFDMEEFYEKVFCEHPDANENTKLNTK